MSAQRQAQPVRTAILGLTVIAVIVLGIFKLGSLPLVGDPGTTYQAEFLDAGGLSAGDPVEVAGVEVGQVNSIEIEQQQIVVDFDVSTGISLGDSTEAAVRVGTLLGEKYLNLVPSGAGEMRANERIPQARTAEAYDVVTAFAELTETTERIDTDQMAQSMDTIATLFKDSPDEVRAAVRGITGFSRTIASRDETIKELLDHAETTTQVLDERSGDIAALVKDASLLAAELERRSDAIHSILVNTRLLARELKLLTSENQAQLTPALNELNEVVDLLNSHQKDLRATLHNTAGYARVFVNTLGSGPWFDSWVPNVPDTVSGNAVN